MHAISSYRGNRPTHTHTHTRRQTEAITIHCAAASAQCKYKLHSEQDSKAPKMALTAALDNTNSIYTVRF